MMIKDNDKKKEIYLNKSLILYINMSSLANGPTDQVIHILDADWYAKSLHKKNNCLSIMKGEEIIFLQDIQMEIFNSIKNLK